MLWDLTAGGQFAVLKGHTDFVTNVAFSPDGEHLASGGDEEDASVRLWDVSSGREVAQLVGHEGAVLCVAFSRDGRNIISGSKDETIRVWDVETGRPVRVLRGHSGNVECLSLSADGMRLASCSNDRTVRVWDIATGQEVHTLKPDAIVFSVAFGPDSLRLSAGCSAGRSNQPAGVTVWDARPLDDTLRAESLARDVIRKSVADGDSLEQARETIRRLAAINPRINALALEQIGRRCAGPTNLK